MEDPVVAVWRLAEERAMVGKRCVRMARTVGKVVVKLDRPGLVPAGVTVDDLIKILDGMKRLAGAYEGASAGEDIADASLALVGVDGGSVAYTLQGSERAAYAAYSATMAIAARDFESLPDGAVSAVKDLGRLAQRGDYSLCLRVEDGAREVEAYVGTEVVEALESIPGQVSGITSVYGILERVGGAVGPTAGIRPLSGGNQLTVRVASLELAQRLARHLYEVVGLQGRAKWRVGTWDLVDFEVYEVLDYKTVPAARAVQQLESASPGAWDDIDPVEYVRKLRAEKSE